jgi:hypothetical protein
MFTSAYFVHVKSLMHERASVLLIVVTVPPTAVQTKNILSCNC